MIISFRINAHPLADFLKEIFKEFGFAVAVVVAFLVIVVGHLHDNAAFSNEQELGKEDDQGEGLGGEAEEEEEEEEEK